MIGIKIYKPLQPDKLTRTVTRTVEIPVYGKNNEIVGYESSEIPDIEEHDNPSPNTYAKYSEIAQWCNENNAVIVEREPDENCPEGCYEVVSSSAMKEEVSAKMSTEGLSAYRLMLAKAERAEAVAALTVEVDGMTFDGDEAAQQRMARAVLMAESPEEQTEWVLADNTVAIVTADQLRRACKAAGKAQTELWVVPYRD